MAATPKSQATLNAREWAHLNMYAAAKTAFVGGSRVLSKTVAFKLG